MTCNIYIYILWQAKSKNEEIKQVIIVLLFAHTIHFYWLSARSTFKYPFCDKK